VLAGVFSHAAVLVGSGVAAGNLVLLLFVVLSPEVEVADVGDALLITSSVMMSVALLACLEPARRALRIQPIEALKEA
jgi:ABC-type antimicrobial peptide transport system permease subunit